MAFVQLSDISLAFGDRDVLKNINLNLDSGSRAALSGPNGSGKSTLMKVLAGVQSPDSGDRIVGKETRIVYLPQSSVVHCGATLRAEAETAFASLHELAKRKEELENRLGRVRESDRETEQLLLEHHEIQEHLLNADYYQRSESIQGVLEGLGFKADDFEKQTDDFSGGWQMRIALAKVLLQRPDILLLDEPTNYLDIEARTWLESWLQRFAGGYLIVSHDRYFLDVTVDEVTELWTGALKRFRGNYTVYEKTRAQELDALIARYEAQQAEIEKTESFINRFRYNASKAAMVQSRIKQLEKIDRIEIPESMKRIHFKFPPAPHSGKQVLELRSIRKSYGDNHVLRGLDLSLMRGEKLVIVGKNGAGKSTMMRIAAQEDGDYEGEVRYGTGVRAGYFSQDMEAHLDGKLSIIEEIEKDAPTHLIPVLRNLLGAFLFPGDDIFKPISVLSGGEKSRVALLKLLLVPSNLLILDEPTNHLDLRSKDVLLDALQAFTGTVMFVSHDRYFIDALATSVLELGPAGPRLFAGDYEYYLWKIAQAGEQPGPAPVREEPVNQTIDEPLEAQTEPVQKPEHQKPEVLPKTILQKRPQRGQSASADYESQKRTKSVIRKLEREQEQLLARLDELEQNQKRLSNLLAQPEVYTDGAKVKRAKEELERNSAEQRMLSTRWEELEAELAAVNES